MRKVFCLLLVVCLLVGVWPAAVSAAQASGTQQTASGEYLYFGGYKWLILDSAKNNAGAEGIFLLAAEPVELGICFQDTGLNNSWADSDAKAWVATFLSKFSQVQRNAILPVSKTETAQDGWISCALENEQVFFLSIQEVQTYLGENGAAGNGWWLRSGYTEKGEAIYAGAVSDAGFVGTPHVAATYDARPALNLDGNKVILYKQADADGWQVAFTEENQSLQTVLDAAGEGGMVRMMADHEQDITVKQSVYLDLNGKDICATVTVAEGATLYGMDSTTDDYDCATGYGKITRIQGSYAAQYKTDADGVVGKIRRYLAVTEEDGISFHRFYVGISSVSLKPNVTGFGYKAVFAGDAKVQSMLHATDAFGYRLWIQDGNAVTVCKGSGDFVSGKIVTLRLQKFNIAQYGETDVHACVYMKLADGTVIESADYAYSMRQMLETISSNLTSYTDQQLEAVKTMLQGVQIPDHWNISALYN